MKTIRDLLLGLGFVIELDDVDGEFTDQPFEVLRKRYQNGVTAELVSAGLSYSVPWLTDAGYLAQFCEISPSFEDVLCNIEYASEDNIRRFDAWLAGLSPFDAWRDST